jgi:ParB family transcriptional regulator, chromosome partitioning protein
MAEKRRRALGRGLDALLPGAGKQGEAPARRGREGLLTCPIERIVPRADQPRQRFDDGPLDELAATIKAHGIIQPLVVRRLGDPGPNERFELIAGERRWKASQRAGLTEVPIVVKDVSTQKAFELALIENLQRQDLNPIEVAEAYQRLLADHGHTHEELADQMGKSRVTITNAIRLLGLPAPVQSLLVDGSLSEGHGRALLGLDDPKAMLGLARKATKEALSVRKLEGLVRSAKTDGGQKKKTKSDDQKSASVRDLEDRFSRRVGARVSLEHRGKGGKVLIRYADLDELDRIIDALGV